MFTHPGESETFGQTLQEAMAAGTPVVAVGCGGPADIVEHGRTGPLYPPGHLDRLREHVQRLEDPGLRAQFAVAGREAMTPRSWSALTDRLLEHYALARQFHRATACAGGQQGGFSPPRGPGPPRPRRGRRRPARRPR